jgi:hypothetical protein
MQWQKFWSVARKAAVGGVGALATGVAYGVFPDPWDKLAVGVLAVATYFGVYHTENAPR